ncbi:ABC transporter permease [Inquilinus sp. CAU 1745]|uniref:ABC transporter permease n=1 Tax=Inquilinus sp. CAU 1745 TaxID=3140369 RepID=UPI00325BCE67
MPSLTLNGGKRKGWSFDLKVYGPLLALLLLVLLGAAMHPAFLSYANITNILTRSAFIGIIAVGATFVITSGGLDLSVGSMAAFISGVMIVVMNAVMVGMGPGWSTVMVGILASLALGFVAGSINGLVTTRGKIEAFIVTLGTMGIFRSLVTYMADGGTLSLAFEVRETYRPVYYDGILGVPYPIIVFAVVAILGEIAMTRTRFGRHCSAIGSNEQVARYSAIHVDNVRTLTYILQGLCVAMATIVYVPRLGSASASTGVLWELEAIAAVIIGGTVLKGGYGRVWGTVVGVLILSLIDNLLNLTEAISPYLNGAIQGVIIIVAVLLQRGKAASR